MIPKTWLIPIKVKDIKILGEEGKLHYELAELTVNLTMLRGNWWTMPESAVAAELSVTFIPNQGHGFKPPS